MQKKSLQQESRLMELEAELAHALTRERAALDRAVKAEMRVRQLEQDIAVQQGAARVLCLQFVAMQYVTACVDTSLTWLRGDRRRRSGRQKSVRCSRMPDSRLWCGSRLFASLSQAQQRVCSGSSVAAAVRRQQDSDLASAGPQ